MKGPIVTVVLLWTVLVSLSNGLSRGARKKDAASSTRHLSMMGGNMGGGSMGKGGMGAQSSANCPSASPASLMEFTAILQQNFQVTDPEDVTEAEIVALEQGFFETYNELADGLCDSNFRRLTRVDIIQQEPSTRRMLKEHERKLLFDFRFTIVVTGECGSLCSDGGPVFADGIRRKLLSLRESRRQKKTTTSSSDDECGCQSSDPSPDRAPTEEEFIDAFDDLIEVLVENGTLENVTGTTGISQIPITEPTCTLGDPEDEFRCECYGDDCDCGEGCYCGPDCLFCFGNCGCFGSECTCISPEGKEGCCPEGNCPFDPFPLER